MFFVAIIQWKSVKNAQTEYVNGLKLDPTAMLS